MYNVKRGINGMAAFRTIHHISNGIDIDLFVNHASDQYVSNLLIRYLIQVLPINNNYINNIYILHANMCQFNCIIDKRLCSLHTNIKGYYCIYCNYHFLVPFTCLVSQPLNVKDNLITEIVIICLLILCYAY